MVSGGTQTFRTIRQMLTSMIFCSIDVYADDVPHSYLPNGAGHHICTVGPIREDNVSFFLQRAGFERTDDPYKWEFLRRERRFITIGTASRHSARYNYGMAFVKILTPVNELEIRLFD